MRRLVSVGKPGADCRDNLTLTWDQRVRSRLRAHLDDGVEVGIFLPRGTIMRGGDVIEDEQGGRVRVRAADETVSTAETADPVALARVSYHLGNRHVPLQVGAGWVRYRHDHVLDDMVRQLGVEVRCEEAPFEPESGAYGGGHGHGHDHGHGHGHHHHDHGPAAEPAHGDAHGY